MSEQARNAMDAAVQTMENRDREMHPRRLQDDYERAQIPMAPRPDPLSFEEMESLIAASFSQMQPPPQAFVMPPELFKERIEPTPATPKVWTLQDLKNDDYKHFESRFREECAEACRYIEATAVTMGADPKDWDIPAVFDPHGNEKPIVTNRRAINRRIYVRMDQTKRDVPNELCQFEKQLIDVARNSIDSIRHGRKESAERSYRHHIHQASERGARWQLSVTEAYRCFRDKIEAEGAEATDWVEEIRKVASHPFWKLVDVNNERAKFTTRAPIVLSHINRSAGVNLQVRFGYFEACLWFHDARISCAGARGNLRVSDCPHPYISGDSVCWGNAHTAVADHLATGRYSQAFELLQALLTTYSPEATPYVDLDAFARRAEENRRGADPDDGTLAEDWEEEEEESGGGF